MYVRTCFCSGVSILWYLKNKRLNPLTTKMNLILYENIQFLRTKDKVHVSEDWSVNVVQGNNS